MTKLLLAGATGLVGTAVLTRLLQDERVTTIIAPTRRPVASHPKIENPLISDAEVPDGADWWSVDGVICAVGTTRAKSPSNATYRAIDYDYPLQIARCARESGATRFALTSSMGANPRSPFFYPRLKGKLEEAISSLDYPSLTILRPGFLAGVRTERRPLEQSVGRILQRAGPLLPPNARISPAETVAKLLVEAAVAATPGRHILGAGEIARAASGRR